MRTAQTVLTIITLTTLIVSCHKKHDGIPDCYPDTPAVRQITNKPCTVRLMNGSYFFIEEGAIDTRLLPCNLSETYQQDGLAVLVDGDIKPIARNTMEPCCTDGLVIRKISKR